MPPSLFLGSLVVAGVLSGLLNTSQAPAGEARQPAPSVSDSLATPIAAPPVATQSATPEQTPRDLQLEVSRAVTLLQLARAAHVDRSPEVVCGTKLWRVNPEVDTGIHRQVPEEAFNAVTRRISPDRDCGAGARAITRRSLTTTIHLAGVKKPDPEARK